MIKIVALTVAIVTAETPALAEEQINIASDETLSVGGWGKVLDQAVFACRLPGDLQTHGSLMIQMNTLQIAKGEPVKASPMGPVGRSLLAPMCSSSELPRGIMM